MSEIVLYGIQAGIALTAVLLIYCLLTTPAILCAILGLVALCVLYRRQQKKLAGTIPLTDKYVLITGCDSGFGFELAKHLHKLDCHVIATVLRPDGRGAKELRDITSEKMTVLPLDVSSDDSVRECLQIVKGMCSDTGLWGLVNNAGQQVIGDAELTTISQYLRVAQVNLYGTVRTTKTFLPLIRQAKGRIVNVTSVRGLIPGPLNTAYNITKYGAETFSDIVRLEMQQFKVKVILVEPGDYSSITDIVKGENLKRIQKDYDEMWAEASDEVRSVYTKEYIDHVLRSLELMEGCPTMTPVVMAMTEALTSGDPDIRYLVGGSKGLVDKYSMLARVKPFLPDRLYDRLSSYVIPYSVTVPK